MNDLATIIERIRKHHRMVCFAIKQQQRNDRALEACIVFDFIGMPHEATEAQRKDVWRSAETMIKEAKGCSLEGRSAHAPLIIDLVRANETARAPWDKLRNAHEREMEKLTLELPIADFPDSVRGFGRKGFAMIIAEAGDLAMYATHSKLWKRMGMAVFDGMAQGKVPKDVTGKARAAAWVERGYSPARRSHLWNIGDALIKGNGDGRYRTIYLTRKELERAKAEALGLQVVPAAKIPKKRASEFMSEGHVHRRAQRYMEKTLLRDLWKAWRRAGQETSADKAGESLPAVAMTQRASREQPSANPALSAASISGDEARGQTPLIEAKQHAPRRRKLFRPLEAAS